MRGHLPSDNRTSAAAFRPALARTRPWYVQPALGARSASSVVFACALGLSACGGGERQDKNEPGGNFPVSVKKASFPQKQKLAKTSDMVIEVENSGSKAIPNIALTVSGFDRKVEDNTLADPKRPTFVINGAPRRLGGFAESKTLSPEGGETAYVDTWALGRLKPGRSKKFKWTVTAVKAGSYKVTYRVSAGLDGKAKAVDASGKSPRGLFIGTVVDKAPDTRVADDGKTVVKGTR